MSPEFPLLPQLHRSSHCYHSYTKITRVPIITIATPRPPEFPCYHSYTVTRVPIVTIATKLVIATTHGRILTYVSVSVCEWLCGSHVSTKTHFLLHKIGLVPRPFPPLVCTVCGGKTQEIWSRAVMSEDSRWLTGGGA